MVSVRPQRVQDSRRVRCRSGWRARNLARAVHVCSRRARLQADGQHGRVPQRIRQTSQRGRLVFEKEIKGLRIRFTHRPGSVREYRVNSVPGSAVSLHFEVDESTAERKSVAEYFAERYAPCSFPSSRPARGSKRRTAYIPVEHCCLAENQKVMKKLTERQASTMIKQAACDAPMRMRKIQSLSSDAKFDKDPWLNASASNSTCVAESWLHRSCSTEKETDLETLSLPREGVWRFDRMCQKQFISKLSRYCNDFGMRIPEWSDQVVADVELASQMKHEAEATEKKCKLIIAILPQKSTQFYSEVKRAGEVQLGLITQVLLMKSVMDVTQKGISPK